MARPKNPRGGRPPISAEKWNEVVALIEQKKSPAEIIELTGLSQTKVYEIQRQVASRIAREFKPKENAPASEQARG